MAPGSARSRSSGWKPAPTRPGQYASVISRSCGRSMRVPSGETAAADGRMEGGYTSALELICPSCGDRPTWITPRSRLGLADMQAAADGRGPVSA